MVGAGAPRDDVLAWAAMELSEVPELEPEPFDVHALVASAGERHGARARAKGLSFEVKLAGSVPDRALGEERWLGTVLDGLLDNAIRFTDAGEVVASVTADPTSGARILLHAEISDTGCGMPTETVRALFRPQGGRFTASELLDGGGSMRVCGRLIDLMDGRIGASSALGMGTTTWFTVPLDLPA
ncbi:MAG: hypothetical protein GXY03_09895 [Solirubrobacterales bacterium]|nr:hypothetical protein [Solirubrobacterales bacterium]